MRCERAQWPATNCYSSWVRTRCTRWHSWKEPKRILEQVRLVVALRPGHGTVEFEALTAIDAAAAERVMVVHMPLIEISGTELRRRMSHGEPVRYLVPDAVGEYIEKHRLYRGVREARPLSGGHNA